MMGLSSSHFGFFINLANDDDNDITVWLICWLMPLCLYVLWAVNYALRMVCSVSWTRMFGGNGGGGGGVSSSRHCNVIFSSK